MEKMSYYSFIAAVIAAGTVQALLQDLGISGVTSAGAVLKMIAAVSRWISPPRRKAAMNASSPDRCASTRSSICE